MTDASALVADIRSFLDRMHCPLMVLTAESDLRHGYLSELLNGRIMHVSDDKNDAIRAAMRRIETGERTDSKRLYTKTCAICGTSFVTANAARTICWRSGCVKKHQKTAEGARPCHGWIDPVTYAKHPCPDQAITYGDYRCPRCWARSRGHEYGATQMSDD